MFTFLTWNAERRNDTRCSSPQVGAKNYFQSIYVFEMQQLYSILHFWKGIITSCRPTKSAIQLILHSKISVPKLPSLQSIFKIVFKIWFRWHQSPKWLELVNDRSETSSVAWHLFLIFVSWSCGDVQVLLIGRINLFHTPHTRANRARQLLQCCLPGNCWSESPTQGLSTTVSIYIPMYIHIYYIHPGIYMHIYSFLHSNTIFLNKMDNEMQHHRQEGIKLTHFSKKCSDFLRICWRINVPNSSL